MQDTYKMNKSQHNLTDKAQSTRHESFINKTTVDGAKQWAMLPKMQRIYQYVRQA